MVQFIGSISSSMLLLLLLVACLLVTQGRCPNQCSGHGKCLPQDKCQCQRGWGASEDIADYKAPDCSMRTCPSGPSWGRFGDSLVGSVHSRDVECSGRGLCNRDNGECRCHAGYTGAACQRSKCFNDCSGHGSCVPMKKIALMANAMPLGGNATYGLNNTDSTWDSDMIYGCVCESSWVVGLGNEETQVPEWFGADCSLRHCPSADDPLTSANETDCSGVATANGQGVGESGNLCQVDCANRGVCDYRTGTCRCFMGHGGLDCSVIDARFLGAFGDVVSPSSQAKSSSGGGKTGQSQDASYAGGSSDLEASLGYDPIAETI